MQKGTCVWNAFGEFSCTPKVQCTTGIDTFDAITHGFMSKKMIGEHVVMRPAESSRSGKTVSAIEPFCGSASCGAF